MRNKTSYYIGLILILIGGGALYNAIFLNDLFSMRNMWPLFILLPGLFLEIDYFSNYRYRDASVLIPGGLLTLIGGYFLLKEFVKTFLPCSIMSVLTWAYVLITTSKVSPIK